MSWIGGGIVIDDISEKKVTMFRMALAMVRQRNRHDHQSLQRCKLRMSGCMRRIHIKRNVQVAKHMPQKN